MKEFLKRLVRFICLIVILFLMPILLIVELIKWAFDMNDAFECYDGLGSEMFEILTFSIFKEASK